MSTRINYVNIQIGLSFLEKFPVKLNYLSLVIQSLLDIQVFNRATFLKLNKRNHLQ